MLDPGSICRSKDTIIKCSDDEQGRVCRVIAIVPEHRWRTAGVPEYKVELIALPVTAFRRENELALVPQVDVHLSEEELAMPPSVNAMHATRQTTASRPHA
jgi:hypothetical protein